MRRSALTPPKWLATSSVYQIMLRTFNEEGTIASVTKELPFLAELGFGVMYLCPIFEADDSEDRKYWSIRQKASETGNPKNPYRMNNYYKIDSEYGTMEDLEKFVQEAHRLGMKVILDLVYLHIGPNAPIIQTHPEFVKQDEEGNIICTEWFFPYLDYKCPGLREYLWSNMTYFVGVLDVDGFRCDVGDQVPLDFWVEGRRRIQAIKPDAVLINEGRNWEYLESGFDASYCFDWNFDLYDIFAGKCTVKHLRERSEDQAAKLPTGSMLIRDIENHDTATDRAKRIEVLAGHDGMELIEVINYFMDGIPMVYCGNELGDTARINFFGNRFFRGNYEVTDRSIASQDYSLRRQEILKKLNHLKKESEVLRWGKTVWLDNSEEDTVISFKRVTETEQMIVIGNTADSGCVVNIKELPEHAEVLLSHNGERKAGDCVELGARGYVVLICGREKQETAR